MQAREILRVKGNRLLSIDPAGRATDAVATMAKENLGSLVVLEQDRMVGMPHLPRAVARDAGARRHAQRRQAADIMVKNPVTATPDMEVNDLRRTMIASGARYLPVLHDGRLIGVISFRDVASGARRTGLRNKMLRDIKNCPRRKLLLGGIGAAGIAAAAAWRYWPEQGFWESVPCRAAAASRNHELVRGMEESTPRACGTATRILSAPATRTAASTSTPRRTACSTGQYARRLFFLNAGCVPGARQRRSRLRGAHAQSTTACARARSSCFTHRARLRRARRARRGVHDLPHPRSATWHASTRIISNGRPRFIRIGDAVAALEQAVRDGARAVKWLPSAMGIDPASSRCDPFFQA